jgi:NTE family protein
VAHDGKTIGIALSGGGYRATLFGLGGLWRLNQTGLLGKLDRVTSVSGGSILAGVLAHRWPDLAFVDGQATNFAQVIVEPIRSFCATTIDWKAGIAGILTPFKSAGEFLAKHYRKSLFGSASIKSLPPARPGVPKFVFYATNLQTGRSFRFRQDLVADYVLGVSKTTDVPLADAVAASSAFPPVFSPIELRTDPDSWEAPHRELENLATLRRRILLADGGIYDNMGLESLVDNVDMVLVSDAGAPFEVQESPWTDNLLQLGRVRDILIDQTRALRKRWLVQEFIDGRKRGAYWGIGTRIDEFGSRPALVRDNDTTARLEHIPTRLRAYSPEEQGRLINWGYALADAALRTRAGVDVADLAWPVPEWSLA